VSEDFPPLGDKSKDLRTVDSFGFLKSQLPHESAARAGTPTLPPGLPLPHAHPSSSVFQEQIGSSKPSSPAPILPPGLTPNISRLNSPSHNCDDNQSRPLSPELTVGGPLTSTRVKDASQISFGSPVQKSATKARNQRKSEFNIGADFKDMSIKSLNQSQPSSTATKGSPLDFGAALASSIKSEQAPVIPSPVSATESQPVTPQTIAPRLSDSPAPRQPRVLRVVETPKVETPPVMTTPSGPASVAGGIRTRSRRQSISSNSIPDTPADAASEADYYPSTSVSRANSPPAASRIGSAPVRSMTKSQVKKERKQKAKEAEAKKVETASVSEEPVQAPIMGRKRKTKKAPTPTPIPSVAPAKPAPPIMPEPASPVKPTPTSPIKTETKVNTTKKPKVREVEPVKEPTPPPVEEPPLPKEVPVEPWRSNNTVEQLLKDSEASGRSVKDLFMERTKPLHELLAEMHKSGELDLNKSSLFNPSNLNQRTDMKCNADDYELLQRPTELNMADRRALVRGEPLRFGGDSLKTRCLITPRGCVLRHLDPEEEERYLELEKRSGGIADPIMIGDDSSNYGGGLDALFANPEKFNICWFDDPPTQQGATSPTSSLEATEAGIPPNVLSAMEADSTRNHDWAVANSAELLNTTPAAVRSFAAVTAQHMLGNPTMLGANPTLDDIAGLTNEELRDLSARSQKDLERSRKDVDSLDKKFAGLLRRNKKLQQQALALAAESDV
jgi:CCR4-NOT transcription complex subunit 4